MSLEPKRQFKIREATLRDAVEVRKMQAESWLATYPNEDAGVPYDWVKERTDNWLTPERLKQSKNIFREVITDQTQFYRLAERSGQIIGFVHALTKEDNKKELEALYILPEVFGSGVGQQLMALANEWIGRAEVGLTVASYNKRAIGFYQKNGFEIVLGSESTYADKIPVVRMVRKGDDREI